MGCTKCEQNNMPKPIAGSCELGNQVLEIFNAAEIVDFHTVVIPTQMGDDTVVVPENNSYRNAVVRYEANDHVYIYGSDGIPVPIKTNAGDFDDLVGRPKYDGNLMTSETDIPSVTAAKQEALDAVAAETDARVLSENGISDRIDDLNVALSDGLEGLAGDLSDEHDARVIAETALSDAIGTEVNDRTNAINQINGTLNKTVIYDLEYDANTSTVNVTEETVNLSTGFTDTTVKAFPVATNTQSGVINPATYQTIQTVSDQMNVILNGTVAIMNIPADPDQEVLTAAWQNATGLTELINGAKIKDVDNSLIWTYYTNTSLWYPAEDASVVEVNQATNTSLGIVKGSTDTGKISVETDGSLSLNGYDTLSTTTETNALAITGLQTSKADATAVPTITMTNTDPGEGVALAANNFIAVYE